MALKEEAGIAPAATSRAAATIASLCGVGVQVGAVIGAANLWPREKALADGMERVTADQMGMLASVMNALALADALAHIGLAPRVQTGIERSSISRQCGPVLVLWMENQLPIVLLQLDHEGLKRMVLRGAVRNSY